MNEQDENGITAFIASQQSEEVVVDALNISSFPGYLMLVGLSNGRDLIIFVHP